jgi:hypothetical protein
MLKTSVKNSRYRSPFSEPCKTGSHEFKNMEISNLKVLTMAFTDDDYSTETESNVSFGAVNFDSTVREAEACQVLGCTRAQKKQRTEVKPRAVLPSNLHAIVMMDKHITKCLYGLDYDYNA